MPITLGDTSITGLGVGGLPNGVVNADNIATGAITRAKMGYAGAVLQTIQSDTTGVVSFTNSNGSFFTFSITPTLASSKVLISGNFIWGGDNPNGYFTLERSIGGGSYSVISNIAGYDESLSGGQTWNAPVNYLDSPNTTSTVTYRIFWYHVIQNGGTMYLNRNYANDTLGLYSDRTGRTVFITQEIAV